MPGDRLQQISDPELVKLSVAGQNDAFGEIVRRYQGLITGLIYSRCQGRISQSEDLAQDTFVIAWQKLSTLDRSDRLGAWLCGIARNVARSAMRKRSEQPSDELVDLAVDASAPLDEVISREQEALLWQSLERIPEKYREPMILFYRQDQSVEQVAEALELSTAAARKRLERGRSMLRNDMAAIVQEKLTSTTPNAKFASGVLAALPLMSGKVTAATIGKVSAASFTCTKLSGILALLAGPLLGIVGGLIGTFSTIHSTRSRRERQFAVRQSVIVWLLVGVFGVLMVTLMALRPVMGSMFFWSGIVLLCLTHVGVTLVMVIRFNRRQRQIRVEDGTIHWKPTETIDPGARWEKPGHVYWILGGSIGGSLAWMVVMSIQASDWLWAGAIVTAGILLVVFCAQTILKKGPQVVRRTLVLSMVGVAAVSFGGLNLRLHAWLARGVESRLVFANYRFPTDSLWITNLLFVVLFGIIFLAMLLNKNLGQLGTSGNAPKDNSN